MFKRPRLRPARPIVNVGLTASLIFLAACSGEKPETPEIREDTSVTSDENVNANGVTLQAVWATSSLSAPIADLAFVGGPEPILAAVLDTGELQLFTLEGDRITSPAALGVAELATGQALVLDEAAISIFPGISQDGSINAYAYNSVLGDPIALDVLPGLGAAGLCAGAPIDATSIMQLAYWTDAEPETLIHGHVQQIDGELAWAPITAIKSPDGPITSCIASFALSFETAETASDLAELVKFDQIFTIARTQDNTLTIRADNMDAKPVSIVDGITVRASEAPTAVAALGTVLYGGYPNGVIVIGGPVGDGHQITFIEPGSLFETQP